MKMDDVIARINELARKAKETALTAEELDEKNFAEALISKSRMKLASSYRKTPLIHIPFPVATCALIDKYWLQGFRSWTSHRIKD